MKNERKGIVELNLQEKEDKSRCCKDTRRCPHMWDLGRKYFRGFLGL